jgi:hypothetical protein
MLNREQLIFQRDYYTGIGVGILTTAVASAFDNKWPILLFIGLIFVLVGVVSGKKLRKGKFK